MAVNSHHEIDSSAITRDTRSSGARFLHSLFQPSNFRNFLIVFIAVQIYLPALWPVWVVFVWALVMAFQDQRFTMPLRMPKDVGGVDRTDYQEELIEESFAWGLVRRTRTIRKLLSAGGILYLGYLRSPNRHDQGRELWLTNSDARTHMFLAGTTGSGKSETLLGLAFNAICWGAGVNYCDGKAETTVPFCTWSLARRPGREDDFLILNYLTGGMDPFQRIVDQEEGRLSGHALLAQSNSMNPFAEGSADFLLQLMASLLPIASGEGAQWQQKAVNMIDALLRTLCYKRAKGEIDAISIGVIRHYLSLQHLVQFYIEGREGKLPELAFLPIKTYFETGLPGFIPSKAHDPTQWDAEVFNQHGYLTSQFARILSMMMDTYGFIFTDKYPEIDIPDVLLNNRILVALIPSLEKSAAEAAALGKLYVSSIRLMMAQTLGYQLEGTKAEVLDTKATNSPYPNIIILDEIAYYFAAGIAVTYAQARSLGFMMVAAVQDVQGLARGEAKEEAASMIANTKIKWTLALEDPEDTFDLIEKAGGDAYYSVLSGHDTVTGTFSTSHKAQTAASVSKTERITLRELKKLNSGEGLIIFKDAVVQSASFYIPDEHKKTSKLAARINRFLQIERPNIKRLPASATTVHHKGDHSVDVIAKILRNDLPRYPSLDDPILLDIVTAAKHIDSIQRFAVSPTERGIVLFETARKALKRAEAAGGTGYLHKPRADDPPELIPTGADDDIPESAFE